MNPLHLDKDIVLQIEKTLKSPMIKYLSYNNLNTEKYDVCISNSSNSRIYAFSWYLNCVTDNWGAMVYNDYEAVMPLPIRKKYGINYVYLPPWVQQLGVFSQDVISDELLKKFLFKIPKKFKKIEIFMNSGNQLDLNNIRPRKNYILNFDKTYDQIQRNFTKGRRSSIKQAQKFNLQIINTKDLESLIKLFVAEKDESLVNKFDFNKLRTLFEYLSSLSKLKTYHVKNENGNLIGGAVFLFDENRITYLFSVINEVGKEQQVMSFLINFIIESHVGTGYILDFEGSMISEIAKFFKSFGAVEEEYYHFLKKRII
jgi:hypothetical protein